jgi:hypothetical protein
MVLGSFYLLAIVTMFASRKEFPPMAMTPGA